MMNTRDELKIKIQLMCGDAVALGPGKADLLDAIAVAGSISGAARAMGMSYRRGWQLVDLMNRCWREPLVETSPGRAQGSGARITEAGKAALAGYRALQTSLAAHAQSAELEQLTASLRLRPLRSQADRADPLNETHSP